jgi:hypothetical protein
MAQVTQRDPRFAYDDVMRMYQDLQERHDELVMQMGDELSPFPGADIDGFLSHFVMSIEFLKGDAAGTTVSLVLPPATQTVARSDPFRYTNGDNKTVDVPLPPGCTLSPKISASDFLTKPAGFFTPGKEAVWMQILNLDARAETPELGPVRIILGETLKREYPDIFEPSLGVAESLGSGGFPARLFFNPYAIIETTFGAFRAIHGTLAYNRITDFPPCGTAVSICASVPLESVDAVKPGDARGRSASEPGSGADPIARLISLSHPIDAPMHVSGAEAFELIERRISSAGGLLATTPEPGPAAGS